MFYKLRLDITTEQTSEQKEEWERCKAFIKSLPAKSDLKRAFRSNDELETVGWEYRYEEICALSSLFPNLKFVLYVRGDEQCRVFFYDGKFERCQAVITYEQPANNWTEIDKQDLLEAKENLLRSIEELKLEELAKRNSAALRASALAKLSKEEIEALGILNID